MVSDITSDVNELAVVEELESDARRKHRGTPRRNAGGKARTLAAFRATPLTYILLIALSVIFLTPLVYMVSIALSSSMTTTTGQFTIFPREFYFSNFIQVFQTRLPVGRFILNSAIIATLSAIGQVLSSSLVGYAFARLRAPGKNLVFMIVLATMMVPGQITMIPQFIIFQRLGWVNTFLPLVLPNFFTNAFNVFLVRQFVTRLPRELDEAAQVDGLGFFGIYRRIILPMMWPILAAIAIFTLTASWGDFMGPLIYLNREELMPLALGLRFMTAVTNEMQAPAWNLVMVGSIILTIPMLIVYYLGQKYLYEMNISTGSGGVKG